MFTKSKVRKLLTLKDKDFPVLTIIRRSDSVIRLTFIKDGSYLFRVFTDMKGSSYIARLNSIRLITSTDVNKDIVFSLDNGIYCILEEAKPHTK